MSVRYLVLVSVLTICFFNCKKSVEQPSYDGFSWEGNPYFQSWSYYLGDPHRSHFSALDQINTGNVAKLKIAWTYQSDGLSPDSNSQIQNNPMVVGDILFGVNASNVLFAVKADTGAKLWEFSPENTDETGLGLCRGFAYWPSNGEEESRLIFSSGSFLYAIDIESGQVIPSFGKGGAKDLLENLGTDPQK